MAEPGESTPLLSTKPSSGTPSGSLDRKNAMVSFRRKSIKKISIRQMSSLIPDDKDEDATTTTTAL
eukprot:scaffold45341_cov153-Skeletonema_marinoi.AAC.1